MSALIPLTAGAQAFRDLLGLRVHPANGRFYCGAPTQCTTLLGLEDSLMWRETLEVWHKSKNLLDSAIYKWAAAMLCDKHYGDEELEAKLWEQIKSRIHGSKYVRGTGEQNGRVIVWPEMRATTEELKTMQGKLADVEKKLAKSSGEKRKLAIELTSREQELEDAKRLRNTTEQLAAEKEGALVELRCRNDEIKSSCSAITTKLEEAQRKSERQAELSKESASQIEELKSASKNFRQRLENANIMIAETNGCLRQLRLENQRLSERNEDFSTQIKDSQNTISRQDSAMKHAEEMSEEWREENKKLHRSQDEAARQIAEQDGALRELRRESQQLREQNAIISDQLVTAQRTIGRQENELEQLKTKSERTIKERDDSLEDLSIQIQQLMDQSKAAVSQLEGLQITYHQQTEELKRSNEECSRLERTTAKLVDQVESLETQLNDSQQETVELKSEKTRLMDKLHNTRTEFDQRLSATMSSSRTVEENLKKSRTEVSKAKEHNEVLATQLKDLEARLESTQAESSKVKSENTSLSHRLSEIEAQMDRETSLKTSAFEKAKNALDESRNEAAQLRATKTELSEQLKDLQVELDESKVRYETVTIDKKTISSQVKDLQSKLEEEKARFGAVKKELDEWEAENEELSVANQDLEKQLQKTNSESMSAGVAHSEALKKAEAAVQQAEAKTKDGHEANMKLYRQLEILKAELDEERARVAAALEQVEHEKVVARKRAAHEAEEAVNELDTMDITPSKRHSRIWRRFSSHRRSS